MAKIKLTKNELKKQKDALKMYNRYLPTLQLKKQQLQTEIRGIEARAREIESRRLALREEFKAWIAVFGEEDEIRTPSGGWLVTVGSIRTGIGNIAGVEIPVFEGADFTIQEYDLFARPLWIDKALARLSAMLLLDLEIKVLEVQIRRLAHELRVTTQRVNLFEKVKIPETMESIKKIRIYLGDQQTAQVVRGKIAKRKVVERSVS
ncbi:MAG: V-type ATP synthase subunit D [Spirochaetes bacterium]|nr:V-type ATP synthase subunit D [Spirochaetota bacterium]